MKVYMKVYVNFQGKENVVSHSSSPSYLRSQISKVIKTKKGRSDDACLHSGVKILFIRDTKTCMCVSSLPQKVKSFRRSYKYIPQKLVVNGHIIVCALVKVN